MPRWAAGAALFAICAVAAGCGGGDDPPAATGPGAEEAERTVRDFLAAGIAGDADAACGLIDLPKELKEQIPCEELVALQAAQAEQGEAEFDGVKIDADSVEELELETFVAENGQSANVTGPNGQQDINLTLLNGEWIISAIPPPRESN